MKLGLIWFTATGEALAERLRQLSGTKWLIYDKTQGTVRQFVQSRFADCDGLVFIGAAGIAVRMVAPLLKSKEQDPAVVVLDELGRFVVPILSGHLGGANELAARISAYLGAVPVITTATDVHRKFAVDVWSRKIGAAIGDVSKIKYISRAVLAGELVGLVSDFPVSGPLPAGIVTDAGLKTGIYVSLSETKRPFPTTLHVIPRIVTVGVGCRRGTDPQAFEAFVLDTLARFDISLKAVEKLTSIDLKKNEACILNFCDKHKILFETYAAEELAALSGSFTPSPFVRRAVGVDNVCERSAICRNKGTLLVRKQVQNGMTVAVACRRWRCEF